MLDLELGDDLFHYASYDMSAIGGPVNTGVMLLENATDPEPADNLNGEIHVLKNATTGITTLTFDVAVGIDDDSYMTPDADTHYVQGYVFFDILSFGQNLPIADSDGTITLEEVERVNDAFYRLQLEEDSDNHGTFTGSVKYIMVNQLDAGDHNTYASSTSDIETLDNDVVIIINDDTDVSVSYQDMNVAGQPELISAEEDANTFFGRY